MTFFTEKMDHLKAEIATSRTRLIEHTNCMKSERKSLRKLERDAKRISVDAWIETIELRICDGLEAVIDADYFANYFPDAAATVVHPAVTTIVWVKNGSKKNRSVALRFGEQVITAPLDQFMSDLGIGAIMIDGIETF